VTDENDILYHYTNFGGFSGIIKSQKLWGTDIKYLNDAQELKYSAGLMAEIFHSLAQELPDLTEEERRECGDFFTTEGPDHRDPSYLGPKKHALRAAAWSLAALVDESQPQMPYDWKWANGYVTCFTTERDSLGQWRGYAGGDGFAVGFDRAKLAELTYQCWDYKAGNRMEPDGRGWVDAPIPGPRPIFYGDEARAENLNLVQNFLRSRISEKPAAVNYFNFVTEMFNAAGRLCMTLKDESFQAEKEWRLIAMFAEASARLNFRQGSYGTGGVVPYIEIGFPRDAIVKVVIGPGNAPDLRERAVRQMLEANGYAIGEVDLERSKVPYRG